MKDVKTKQISHKLHELIVLIKLISDIKDNSGYYLKIKFGDNIPSFLVDDTYSEENLHGHIEAIIHNYRCRYSSHYMQIIITVNTKENSSYTFLSCYFSEFPHCCGKILGHTLLMNSSTMNHIDSSQLIASNYIISEDAREKILSKNDGNRIKILDYYFDIARDFLAISPYTSMSIIVSRENGRLFTLFPKLKGFKLVHEFVNQRMSTKNVCQEYEFNLDY